MAQKTAQGNALKEAKDQIATTTTTNTEKTAGSKATIIDIPAAETPAATCCACACSCASLKLNLSSSSTSTASVASASSYDTDSSDAASSTCCTRPGEHIYMQRVTSSAKPLSLPTATATTRNDDDCVCIAMSGDAYYCPIKANHHNNNNSNNNNIDCDDIKPRKYFPWFILLISSIEALMFAYDQYASKSSSSSGTTDFENFGRVPIPIDSVLVYRPDRRLEIWRYFSYMFLHANQSHLLFNMVTQLFFGIPLEMMHGTARIGIIYMAGVLAGSLGTSVVDSEVFLVGASGGVYALLAAHVANITLNYGYMGTSYLQLGCVLLYGSIDLGYTLYTHYNTPLPALHALTLAPQVSYIAHITGAMAGLTIGFLVLKNFGQHPQGRLIHWVAFGVYAAFILFAITFNIANTFTAQLVEQEGEILAQRLMQDLGVY